MSQTLWEKPIERITAAQLKKLGVLGNLIDKGYWRDVLLNRFGVTSRTDLTKIQAMDFIDVLESELEENG